MKAGSADCALLAVYGTLRRRSVFQRLPLAVSRLQFLGCGLIRGRLFWQRTYPALIQEHGIVQVELFQIVDANVWDKLDLYEGCDPSNLAASLFIRRQVLLWNPRVWAWAYFLNRQIPRGIRHGEDGEKFTTKTQRLILQK
ncbi:MAG TPA: gamma-glutamylcyclotransferase family protein [Chthoniobacterales bacterium]|jgi:gamma-glutamylcyclotransferase (GGCT)/AIG2-like uncharacterized protein YtfP|nr:gamma-glutamylcyclotransferase family protein [Chthoniobacterales bacterium]